MPRPPLCRQIFAAMVAGGLLAVAGCGAIATAPAARGVCYSSNGKVDPKIVRESDCWQTGGTWDDRPR